MTLTAEIVPPKPDGRTLANLPPWTLCEVDFGATFRSQARYRDGLDKVWVVSEGIPRYASDEPSAYPIVRIIGCLVFTKKDGKLTVEIVPFEEPKRTLEDLEPWEFAWCNHPTVGRVLRCRNEDYRVLELSADGVPVGVCAASPSEYIVDRIEGQLRFTVEGEKGTGDGT
ncbi:hypothetical protein LCGC14_0893090 [marine sediment metagenome]|uniref:Uncharacterized protein n=1 Tax=marine sediment metagenome TaxID=412755 RepID=A0A0F9NYP1_9ZZZZ